MMKWGLTLMLVATPMIAKKEEKTMTMEEFFNWMTENGGWAILSRLAARDRSDELNEVINKALIREMMEKTNS